MKDLFRFVKILNRVIVGIRFGRFVLKGGGEIIPDCSVEELLDHLKYQKIHLMGVHLLLTGETLVNLLTRGMGGSGFWV